MIIKMSVISLLILSTYTDLKDNKIYNSYLLFYLIAGFFYHLFFSEINVVSNLLWGFLLPLSLIPFFVLRMLGAGDIKLFMVIGVWIGWRGISIVMIYATLFGGVIALVLLIVRKNGCRRIKYLLNYLKYSLMTLSITEYQSYGDENEKARFPYGVAVFLGYLIYIVLGNVF